MRQTQNIPQAQDRSRTCGEECAARVPAVSLSRVASTARAVTSPQPVTASHKPSPEFRDRGVCRKSIGARQTFRCDRLFSLFDTSSSANDVARGTSAGRGTAGAAGLVGLNSERRAGRGLGTAGYTTARSQLEHVETTTPGRQASRANDSPGSSRRASRQAYRLRGIDAPTLTRLAASCDPLVLTPARDASGLPCSSGPTSSRQAKRRAAARVLVVSVAVTRPPARKFRPVGYLSHCAGHSVVIVIDLCHLSVFTSAGGPLAPQNPHSLPVESKPEQAARSHEQANTEGLAAGGRGLRAGPAAQG